MGGQLVKLDAFGDGYVGAGRTLAVANQKGGVGKTTTAINLGTALAAVNKRVLIIDLDPQGNASTGLGVRPRDRTVGSYDVMFCECDLISARTVTRIPNLDIVPATMDLSGAEIELVQVSDREFCLRQALYGRRKVYDYVLIDCPPSLGLITLNAFVAADAVLVPLQCEFYALEGLSQLVRTVERTRRAFNPTLEIQGIVLTMFDRRNNLSQMVAQDVRQFMGEKVYKTMIPRNVRISEAPSHGQPVLLYDLKCPGATAYAHLASEVLKREKQLAA
jgi:chromosome partitioning protein